MKKLGLALLCILSSCGLIKESVKTDLSKPLVIVSASPYIKIVKEIAGDTFSVRSIIPPDVDPHNYEPSPKDMGPLSHTALWIQVGEEFEYLLEKRLKETTPSIQILNLPSITKVLHSSCKHHNHDHGRCNDAVDTHYWLDPLTVISQAKAITEQLITIEPAKASYFKDNLAKMTQNLNTLNKELTKKLAPFHGDAFLTTHKAYGYFCNRYHLGQTGIEADDGKEMRSKDIHKVVEWAKANKENLIVILTQPQHVNRAAQTIGKTLDLPLISVNPYEEDYILTINTLADITVKYGKKSQVN